MFRLGVNLDFSSFLLHHCRVEMQVMEPTERSEMGASVWFCVPVGSCAFPSLLPG